MHKGSVVAISSHVLVLLVEVNLVSDNLESFGIVQNVKRLDDGIGLTRRANERIPKSNFGRFDLSDGHCIARAELFSVEQKGVTCQPSRLGVEQT